MSTEDIKQLRRYLAGRGVVPAGPASDQAQLERIDQKAAQLVESPLSAGIDDLDWSDGAVTEEAKAAVGQDEAHTVILPHPHALLPALNGSPVETKLARGRMEADRAALAQVKREARRRMAGLRRQGAMAFDVARKLKPQQK